MDGSTVERLQRFIYEANKPHADGSAAIKQESDGSRTIIYDDNEFKMHDNFFGGEPYGGRLVVYRKDRPVFLEVYYGRVYTTKRSAQEVYNFLREALRHATSDSPYRGPAEYSSEGLTYKCTVTGTVHYHTITEYIFEGNTEIYSATIVGGLVDQNESDAL